jgi:hypothetical protein
VAVLFDNLEKGWSTHVVWAESAARQKSALISVAAAERFL